MHNRGIAMWGPSGSGKTWLIWAFIKALENSYENDAKFSYHLSGKDRTGSWRELFASTPKVAPTNSYCNYEWRFENRVKDTSRAQGGARTDSIVLCDDAGKRTVGALSEPERYRNTYHTLSHTAQAVVLALDYTLLDQGYKKRRYAREVRSLCSLLERSANADNKSRCVAVCVTKMDRGLAKIRGRDPLELVELSFGKNMLRVLEKFQDARAKSNGLYLECFKVSSVGFYNEKTPNYDEGQDNLRYEDRWNPWNAIDPFLWILDQPGLK